MLATCVCPLPGDALQRGDDRRLLCRLDGAQIEEHALVLHARDDRRLPLAQASGELIGAHALARHGNHTRWQCGPGRSAAAEYRARLDDFDLQFRTTAV